MKKSPRRNQQIANPPFGGGGFWVEFIKINEKI